MFKKQYAKYDYLFLKVQTTVDYTISPEFTNYIIFKKLTNKYHFFFLNLKFLSSRSFCGRIPTLQLMSVSVFLLRLVWVLMVIWHFIIFLLFPRLLLSLLFPLTNLVFYLKLKFFYLLFFVVFQIDFVSVTVFVSTFKRLHRQCHFDDHSFCLVWVWLLAYRCFF